jgi:hypothetical protein
LKYSDVISTIGVSLILLAFFLSSFKYLSDKSKFYFVLNMIGGAFACYGSILLESLPFIILEGIWSVVALIALVRLFSKNGHLDE